MKWNQLFKRLVQTYLLNAKLTDCNESGDSYDCWWFRVGQDVLVGLGQIPDQPPSWYDPAKFQRGQQFFQRNFAGIFMAHMLSLITLLSSPQILKPLIFTQRSETTWKAFERYISTVVHVSCWWMIIFNRFVITTRPGKFQDNGSNELEVKTDKTRIIIRQWRQFKSKSQW